MKCLRWGPCVFCVIGMVALACAGIRAQTQPKAAEANAPVVVSNQPRSFEETFPTPLLRAIALKDDPAVRSLIYRKAPVNVPDGTDYNHNPILLAAISGEPSIVKVLLAAGANIEARGQFGMTALMLATLKGNTRIVELLIIRGAKVNARADNGATAVMTGARDNFPELVELLIRHGADVNLSTQTGFTPLMAAADDDAMVLLLLRSGAKSDLTNADGQTAACLAAVKKHSKKVLALAKYDPSATRPCQKEFSR